MAAAVITSTLSELLTLARVVMSAVGDATPVNIGAQYRDRGIGGAPVIVFVPEKRGSWGPPLKLNAGLIASVTHGCEVYVRAVESGDDATRFAAAEALAGRVIGILRSLAPARIEGGDWSDDSPTGVDAHGADLALTFRYTRCVAEDVTLTAAVKAAIAPRSPADPDRPNGDTGTTIKTTFATEPKR